MGLEWYVEIISPCLERVAAGIQHSRILIMVQKLHYEIVFRRNPRIPL